MKLYEENNGFIEILIPVRLFGKQNQQCISPQIYAPVQKYLNSYLGSQYSSKIAGKAS